VSVAIEDLEGDLMPGEHPIDVMILATDLGVARKFYGDGIGLARIGSAAASTQATVPAPARSGRAAAD
jgi:hypothetical protein